MVFFITLFFFLTSLCDIRSEYYSEKVTLVFFIFVIINYFYYEYEICKFILGEL